MYIKLFLLTLALPLTVVSVSTDYKPSPEMLHVFGILTTALCAILVRYLEKKEVISKARKDAEIEAIGFNSEDTQEVSQAKQTVRVSKLLTKNVVRG